MENIGRVDKQKVLIIVFLFFICAIVIVTIMAVKVSKNNNEKKVVNNSDISIQATRPSAVSGSFYPKNANELSAMIMEFLNSSVKIVNKDKLKILIVPHAGLEYSGNVAGAGFKQIEGQNYSKVIILGVSHRVWFDYVAIYNNGLWETPLGKISIDGELANKLVDEDKKIIFDTKPHKDEHSLEVQLVFLQKVLKDFKIVPVLLGQVSDEVLQSLAEKISENLDGNTLLVISSDLSHYPDWQTANKVDWETIKAVLSGDENNFDKTIAKSMSAGFSNLETCACGEQAIKVALKVAKKLSFSDIQKINYGNSGDIVDDKSRVVGYASIGVWGLEEKRISLNKEDQKEALQIARKTLKEYLTNGKIPEIKLTNKILNEKLGVFVTLRKNDDLRGCIGMFEPEDPLYLSIQKMAIAAAVEDSRFISVTKEELKDLTIEISVMTPMVKVGDWKEIILGKHGVVIKQGNRGGTFLPQVATETGWTLNEFLGHCSRDKAGLGWDGWKEADIYIYEAIVFSESELR